ncbi:MAG: reverse transcriptase family protein [Planctomycetota bacterium]|jgi:retron-type reverse transcriptase
MGFFKKILKVLLGAGDPSRGAPLRQAAAPPPPENRIPGTLLPEVFRAGHREVPFGKGAFDRVLRFKRRNLNFLAYHKKDPYRVHRIPKRGGGFRTIHEPCPALKVVQRKILHELLDKVILHRCCHGFAKKRSIVSNARCHEGRELVVCMDLRDFFPTITFARVFGFFNSLGFSSSDAGLLARLTTFEGRLPQGAPTSGGLANLIARRLDRRLAGLAEKAGATYSRYADDLAFSGPQAILKILPTVRKIATEEGFSVAEEKTRIMRRGSRQKVCGVVVNERAHLPRETRRRIRAMMHRASLPEDRRAGPAPSPTTLQGFKGLVRMFEGG